MPALAAQACIGKAKARAQAPAASRGLDFADAEDPLTKTLEELQAVAKSMESLLPLVRGAGLRARRHRSQADDRQSTFAPPELSSKQTNKG